MTTGQNAPILMGVYRFPKLLTSKSEPAILGVLPGRVWLTGQDGVFFDAPADQVSAKANSTVGHVTLEADGTKHIVPAGDRGRRDHAVTDGRPQPVHRHPGQG